MKKLRNFGAGAVLPFRSLKLLLKNRQYWPLIAIPLIINTVLYALVTTVAWHYTSTALSFVQSGEDSWGFLSFLIPAYNFAVSAGTLAASVALFGMIFIYVFLIIEAPFLTVLSEKVEEDYFGNTFNNSGWKNMLAGILLGVKNALLLSIVTMFCSFVFFLLNFVLPGIAAVCGFFVISYFYGVSFLMYSAESRMMNIRKVKQLLSGNKAVVLGFGAVCYASIFVPLLPIAILPIAVIGGTLLFNEYLEDKNLPEGVDLD